MPNVGRPSKGCQSCRSRKVKCDQKRPSCSQCIRASRECFGYRDALSMMFKNESDVVAKKAEKRYQVLARRKGGSPATRGMPITPDPTSPEVWDLDGDWLSNAKTTHLVPFTQCSTPESMVREVMPSVEDQALGFFIGNYVSRPKFVPRGQFEWVTELIANPLTEDILRHSINAASLASFAVATKSPIIMQQAQAAYGSALHLTNAALRINETAVKDSTLMSVIMLGTYENFVFQDKRSVQAWQRHVDGACSLLSLRGKEQFQRELSRRLFHQFYGTILLVALETGRPVHQGMRELYHHMTPNSEYSVHGRAWTTRLVDVMHGSISLNQDRDSDPNSMVNTALDLDRELNDIKALMPTVWDSERISLESPSEHLYGNVYDIYLDPWIAQMWNNLTSCRINLFKVVQTNLAKGMLFEPPLFAQEEHAELGTRALQIQMESVQAIVAAVPQITGMIPFPDPQTARRRASDPTISISEETGAMKGVSQPGTYLDPTQSTQMVHLIWPLYDAAKLPFASKEMVQWAIGILHFIALRIGNRQAVVLADELKEQLQHVGVYNTPSISHALEEV
ncbi:hypothetical protein DE146DRAFT_456302 [Phaeosphaeria sp. MPI-PUGE-AT-0046c]|nr:hypothetical protein DE146DRAFT_456302 [Phaeosphaeria sp. MPI-PUGE-AT-0046c]